MFSCFFKSYKSYLTTYRYRGVFVYAVLNGLIGLTVFLSRGYLEPREYDLKEYWTWKGSGRPPWFVRAMRRRRGLYSTDAEEADQDEDEQHVSQSVRRSQSRAGSVTTKEDGPAVHEQPGSEVQGLHAPV